MPECLTHEIDSPVAFPDVGIAVPSVLASVVPGDLCEYSPGLWDHCDSPCQQRRRCCVATRGVQVAAQSGYVHQKRLPCLLGVNPSQDGDGRVVAYLHRCWEEVAVYPVGQSWAVYSSQRVRARWSL